MVALELRDELAVRFATALAPSNPGSPREVAVQAYALADAMLLERFENPVDEGIARLLASERPVRDVGAEVNGYSSYFANDDLGPVHDPEWEVEPRWSQSDQAALQRRVEERAEGPGLAATRRPSAPPRADVDEA
ncbi:MAG: hypothetical protein AAGA56_25855, partial [Myxococcota bacterium]